jgi:hypothetical protein
MREGLIGTSVVNMHHFTLSLQQLSPAYLDWYPNGLITTHIVWRIVLSSCRMTLTYPGCRVIEEVYMKFKRRWEWLWARHFDYALTSKWGRDWKVLQSSRCTAPLSHCSRMFGIHPLPSSFPDINSLIWRIVFTCSNYALHTCTAILIASYHLTYFDEMASLCKMTVPYLGYRIVV